MIESVPSAARIAPPETGASMKKMSSRPMSFNSFSTLCAYALGTVEVSNSVAPLGSPFAMPSSPKIAVCACCAVATMQM
jgi:hypothetical protein